MLYKPEIHHRKSIRLHDYDYSKAGMYFITICTFSRNCLFGEIKNGRMILNENGRYADECWVKIPEHFPDARLHGHVVMPNHVHGIIEITGDAGGGENVGVQNFEPLRPPAKKNEFQKIIPRSIGSIVRGYKIGVTKWFRVNTDIQTVWQRNFWEHIIRNQRAYENISNYIENNPVKWNEDRFRK